MTDIYSGTGWFSKTQVGECGNGDIYKGYGWGKTQSVHTKTATFTAVMAGDVHKLECTAMVKSTLVTAGERRRLDVMRMAISMQAMAGGEL